MDGKCCPSMWSLGNRSMKLIYLEHAHHGRPGRWWWKQNGTFSRHQGGEGRYLYRRQNSRPPLSRAPRVTVDAETDASASRSRLECRFNASL